MAKSSYSLKKSRVDSKKQKVAPAVVSPKVEATTNFPVVVIHTEKLFLGILGRTMKTSKTPEQYIVLRDGAVIDSINKDEFLALLESNSIDTTRFNKEFYTLIPVVKPETEAEVAPVEVITEDASVATSKKAKAVRKPKTAKKGPVKA